MTRVHWGMLRMAGWLVPASLRGEWIAEWRAELHWVPAECATAFCLGAFRDALWLRRNAVDGKRLWLDDPVMCVLNLAAAAGVLVGVALWLPESRGGAGAPWFSHLMVIGIAALLLPAVVPMSLGEYPAERRFRRWVFLAVKLGLVAPIVFFAAYDCGRLLAPQMQAHGLIVGYVLGFRWVIVDQRSRCPICLRRLACPARIGCSSNVLLDWYGTELVCRKGHGVLHVPELMGSSYSAPRWVELDDSWRGLFSRG